MKILKKIFNKKLTVGIDINEVLRSRWLMFDRYYAEEFGEEGIPPINESYTYDFFNTYKFNDIEEIEKFLKEDFPDDINPKFYQVDLETNEAPVDSLLFKKEKRFLTAKQVFERFIYQDYLLEIHGLAPLMYKGMETDIQNFYQKYYKNVDFIIVSKENSMTIPPTLFFLSKLMFRAKKYFLVETNKEIWKNVDILITADPELLNNIPFGKKVIKVNRPFNINIKSKWLDVLQINDLTENKIFEKLVNYKK
jgi:hypothetical protein